MGKSTSTSVPRSQVQQALFSALYATETEDVKTCLNEIHGALLKSDKKQITVTNKIGGFLKSITGGNSATAAPTVSNEMVTSEERKQLIFGLGLALSPPKVQLPTLKVREFHKICQLNRKETDPNKLVALRDLTITTISWFEINQKLTEELKEIRAKHSKDRSKKSTGSTATASGSTTATTNGPTSTATPDSSATEGQNNSEAPNRSSSSKQKVQALIEGQKMKEVCQNLGICQDALTRIKMDIVQSSRLRERKQLETITLHLLDAVRCHTDGGDLIYEINEIRMQSRKRKRPTNAAALSGGGVT